MLHIINFLEMITEGWSMSKVINGFCCPFPNDKYPVVSIAHGGGGRLMQQLITSMFEAGLGNKYLRQQLDSAVIPWMEISQNREARLAFTTDSYVVSPLFFPGGNIGKLAVCGTVNDLAMVGARPIALSLGLIIEEGFAIQELFEIITTISDTANQIGVSIATGDTKVVERGKADRLFINTSGIGILEHGLELSPQKIESGDSVILSGDIARHGMAIMRVREGLSFAAEFESDCAELWSAVDGLIKSGVTIHAMRDLTRGGLASGLVEISQSANVEIEIRENSIPIRDDVFAACEILGLDPIYVANEGCFVMFCPCSEEQRALNALRSFAPQAQVIGKVNSRERGRVILRTRLGSSRAIEMFSGEQLPRIC